MWSGQQSSDAQPQQIPSDNDASISSDVFGHTAYLDGLASKINISLALAEMQKVLAGTPLTEKVGITQAQRVKPQLLDDEHVLQFLWAENFNAPDAARRLVRYWNDRYKLFGPDKFCMPMTLTGAMKDDSVALSRGYVQLLPETDTAGRAVLYIDWSCHEPSVGYNEDSMHRVLWYMMHVAIEDLNVLQRGVVMLIYPQEARLDQFDHALWSSMAESCRNSLPVRWRSTHIVHPNRFFSIIHPVFMSSLPKDIQDRVVVHSGTKMKVLANLLRYCLPWDRIPSELGGCIDLDFEKWLSERMAKEEQASAQKSSANNQCSSVFNPTLQNVGDASSNTLGFQTISVPDQATSGDGAAAVQGAFVQQQQAFGGGMDQYLINLSQAQGGGGNDTSDGKAAVAKGPKIIVKSGRKSDPRMDRAVELKLNDPSLSLLDALRQGGFVFPDLDDSSTPQYTVVDSDNVKITQRKNQLLRRIRSAKKKGV